VETYIHPADRPAAQMRREYVAMYLAVWTWLRHMAKLHTVETQQKYNMRNTAILTA